MKLFKKALPNFIIIILSILLFVGIGYKFGRETDEDVFDLEMKILGREYLIVEICDFVKEKYNVDVIEEMKIDITELLTKAWEKEGIELDKIEKRKNELNEYYDEFYSFIERTRKKGR